MSSLAVPEGGAPPVPPAADFGPRIQTLEAALGSRRRPVTVPLSIALHAAALIAVLVLPLMGAQQLPAPASEVTAFFVAPAVVAPPPPPPPPAPRPAAPKARVSKPPHTGTFTAPVAVPDEVRPEEALDLGLEGGVPGGVEGGLPGGVVGGVVGGLSGEPPPPVAPVRVGGAVREPTKLRHVAPEYPDLARQARVSGVVIVEALIAPNGRVADAKVLRSVPLLDEPALAAVKQWVYSPTLLDGVPVPVLMTVTVNFQLTF